MRGISSTVRLSALTGSCLRLAGSFKGGVVMDSLARLGFVGSATRPRFNVAEPWHAYLAVLVW
jgi:hypothetical protein